MNPRGPVRGSLARVEGRHVPALRDDVIWSRCLFFCAFDHHDKIGSRYLLNVMTGIMNDGSFFWNFGNA